MTKQFRVKSKDLIKVDFNTNQIFLNLENKDDKFEHWYKWVSNKFDGEKILTDKQLIGLFNSFIKKDAELSRSKFNVEVKKQDNAPYSQDDVDAYLTSRPDLIKHIDNIYIQLMRTFLTKIDRIMVYLALKELKYKHEIKFSEFINLHSSLMGKYQNTESNGIRIYNIQSIVTLYLNEKNNL